MVSGTAAVTETFNYQNRFQVSLAYRTASKRKISIQCVESYDFKIHSRTSRCGFLSLSSTSAEFFYQETRHGFYCLQMNLNITSAQSPSRILLSNATACQVLANIATMQLFYSVSGYAYSLYDTYIWESQRTPSDWSTSTIR